MGQWNIFLRAAPALAWACSEAPSAEGQARLLCAKCFALPPAVEGENPLIGEPSPCTVNSTEVGRDFEGFGLSAGPAVQLIEQQASAVGRYRPMLFIEQWIGAHAVRGYDSAPLVDVAVEVTGVTLNERVGPEGCEGRSLKLRARISVSTSDGALSGSFEDASFRFYGDAEAITTAPADAATFTGSLDFRRDRYVFRSLAAALHLTLEPGSLHGYLDFAVITANGAFGALTLEWPVDATPPS